MTLSGPPTDRLALQRAEAGRWLAIETAGLYGTVAAAEVTSDACQIVASRALSKDSRSAQTLAPAMQSLLDGLGWEASSLSAVAVAVGPGSFTGLRVGIATAKVFAYATGTAVIGVDTLDALADAAPPPTEGEGAGLWTVLDAQRSELFAGHYRRQADRWVRDEPTQRLTRSVMVDRANPADLVVGPVAGSLADLEGLDKLNVEPHAEAVIRVAWRRWQNGAADNVFALAPQYHRLSAAEEKAAEKLAVEKE